MGSALRLILLQLSIVLINGAEFHVKQLDHLEAEEGESITIPCSFTYPERYRPTAISIRWRRNKFHGEFIINTRDGFVHPDYRGRVEFLGHPYTENTGSIRIKQLKQSDSRKYFCRVETLGGKSEQWQNIPGTALAVRGRTSPTAWPTNARDKTVDHPPPAKVASWMLALIGCCVLAALVIGLGAIAGVYIRKKKRENIRQEEVQHIPIVNDYQSKNMDRDQKDPSNQSHPTNAAVAKDDDSAGIVYATLQVKESPPTKSSASPSEDNVLYAAVRFQAETN
ncbi:paired immunoglobulin-like type 2 receptor beta [Heptranchias perlo]|uniref:paired immunoglobulin-like type 2 receptor beta n=1 Tax=Heptranchias perlo TaxID=212740 RepID=UPI00355A2CC9